MAINPEIFVEENEFRNSVSDIISKVKSARKLPGVEEIFIPGEKGDKKKKEVLESGEIEIEDNLFKQLKEVAKRK